MNITVLDTETCGLEAGVIELAGVRLGKNGGLLDYYQTFVNPEGVPIELEARATHHIRDSDLVGAPTIEQFMATAMGQGFFVDERVVLAAHNAPFDSRMLPARFASSNLILDKSHPSGRGSRPWICTYRIALHLWPEAPGHSNQMLRYWLELDVDDMPGAGGLSAHRALYDAWVTAKLLQLEIATIQSRFVVDRVEATQIAIRMSGEPALLTRVTFGKYKGKQWRDVDRGYLRWVLTGSDNVDAVHTARSLMA